MNKQEITNELSKRCSVQGNLMLLAKGKLNAYDKAEFVDFIIRYSAENGLTMNKTAIEAKLKRFENSNAIDVMSVGGTLSELTKLL